MAIGTYAQLQTAAANYLHRSDLTSRIPEFIALAEAVLNRELRLRPKESDESLTGVVGSRFIPLPSGFVEPLALFIERDTGREALTPVAATIDTSSDDGEPIYWAIDGANIAFERPCDSAYSFTLRCLKTLALSDASPTNTLLTSDPDVYLQAVLAEGFRYDIGEEQRADYWEAKRDASIDAINRREAQSRKAPLRADAGLVGRGGFNINRGW